MDDAPLTPDDETWHAALLAEVGPEGAHTIAEAFGVDPDTL